MTMLLDTSVGKSEEPMTGSGGGRKRGRTMPGLRERYGRRIVAPGMRNPFRFTVRPGTSELWVGDVGWRTWQEINVIPGRRRAGRQPRVAVLRRRRAHARLRPARRSRHGGSTHATRELAWFRWEYGAKIGGCR